MVRKNAAEVMAELNAELEKKSNRIWIVAVGWCVGKTAGQLQVGDVTLWDNAAKSVVNKILEETENAVLVEFEEDCEYYQRWLSRDRIVAIDGVVV